MFLYFPYDSFIQKQDNQHLRIRQNTLAAVSNSRQCENMQIDLIRTIIYDAQRGKYLSMQVFQKEDM